MMLYFKTIVSGTIAADSSGLSQANAKLLILVKSAKISGQLIFTEMFFDFDCQGWSHNGSQFIDFGCADILDGLERPE